MTAILIGANIMYGSVVTSARAMRSSQLAVTTLLIEKGEGGPLLPVSFKGMLQRGFTEPDFGDLAFRERQAADVRFFRARDVKSAVEAARCRCHHQFTQKGTSSGTPFPMPAVPRT